MTNILNFIIGLGVGIVIAYFILQSQSEPEPPTDRMGELEAVIGGGHFVLRELTLQGYELDPIFCQDEFWKDMIYTNIYRIRMATLELNKLRAEYNMPLVENNDEERYRKRILDAAIGEIWEDIQLPPEEQNKRPLYCVEYAKELKAFTSSELAQLDRDSLRADLERRLTGEEVATDSDDAESGEDSDDEPGVEPPPASG